MADQFITELDALTLLEDTDLMAVEDNPSGTPETMKMTVADVVTNFLKRINYQITRSVASNNLTVGVVDSDGNNATAAKPLTFNINGSMRKLSAALSVTVNAGVNTFNLGAAEFVQLPQELFVYVGWRASDTSVFIILSRLPHLREYADFSATATNEYYGAYSGAAPTGTDKVAVIGRVNVTNSGTASYNWSVPLADIIIHRPIYETTVLSYLPQWTATGTAPALGNGTLTGRYQVGRRREFVNGQLTAGSTTTFGTGTYLFSLPLTTKNDVTFPGYGSIFDNSADTIYNANANFNANVNTVRIRSHATAGLISGTVPITLAANDVVYFAGEAPLV